MPEGNELHRWANLHQEVFAGKKVHVDSPQGRFLEAPLLDGRILHKVTAVGKHLGYDFGVIEGEQRILHIHMGLYGDFTEGHPPLPEPRGALRLRIWTRQDWLELRGPTDCSLWTEAQWKSLLDRLGPDPLNRDQPTHMLERIAKRKTAIGLLLMDQSILSGVGNIYRAELLFRARLSPFRPGNQVPQQTLRSLYKDAVQLMPHAMVDRRIVTTKPNDRPHRKGEALDEEAHYVYRRQGRPCFLCGTPIKTQLMAGRNLFWCPTCQAE
jgi:endonuclease-8